MTALSHCEQIQLRLQQHEFSVIDHNPAASADEYQKTLGTKLSQQVKMGLIRFKGSHEHGYCAVALPAFKQANLDEIKVKIGAKSVRLATKDELFLETGCQFG